MLRDAEHFKSRVGGLDGAGDAGDYIVGLVKAKSVPKPKPPVPESNPAKASATEDTVTNGKSSNVPLDDGPSEVDEKGRQEEKQVKEATEHAAA
jgi:vacuolar protein sorting-associated protein 54